MGLFGESGTMTDTSLQALGKLKHSGSLSHNYSMISSAKKIKRDAIEIHFENGMLSGCLKPCWMIAESSVYVC